MKWVIIYLCPVFKKYKDFSGKPHDPPPSSLSAVPSFAVPPMSRKLVLSLQPLNSPAPSQGTVREVQVALGSFPRLAHPSPTRNVAPPLHSQISPHIQPFMSPLLDSLLIFNPLPSAFFPLHLQQLSLKHRGTFQSLSALIS